MKKYRVPKTKTVITPTITPNKKNPKYFDIRFKKKKKHLTPAEKNWINLQINEQKRADKKARSEKRISPDNVIKILLGILMILYIFSKIFPDIFS